VKKLSTLFDYNENTRKKKKELIRLTKTLQLRTVNIIYAAKDFN